jgi:hypothetical protein
VVAKKTKMVDKKVYHNDFLCLLLCLLKDKILLANKMVKFICNRCNYETEYKQNADKHLVCKKLCGSIDKELKIMRIDDFEIECKYCNLIFSSNRTLKTHYKTCKVGIDESDSESIKDLFDFDEESLNYIYLLKEREFLKSKEHIFKIGFTSRDILARTNGYPKGSKIYCVLPVAGDPELKLINLFKNNFKHREDIGNEYFEGSFNKMFGLLQKTLYN